MPKRTGKKQARDAAGRFPPGKSGNPAGRPRGARNRATLAAQALLEGEAEALTRKAVELAKGGDVTALRLCLERLIPRCKDAPVHLPDVPTMETAADAAKVAGRLVAEVMSGELTPGEGAAVAGLVETYRRSLETEDLERRIKALETAGR